MDNKKQVPVTGSMEEFVLGPRMKASVIERLEDTLIAFGHFSPQLEKIHDQLLQETTNEDIASLSLTEIVNIIEVQAGICRLAKKLHENLVRDIYVRAKHCRKWRESEMYLTEEVVQSSDVRVHSN